jgi:hypothetical protein
MTDVLLDNNNDLLISGGDFALGDSTLQEVESIIVSYPGWWKQYPLVGCSAPNYLNSPGVGQQLSNNINQQLKLDGKVITSFSAKINTNGTLTINVNGQSIEITN